MRTPILLAVAVIIAAATAFAVKGRISDNAAPQANQPAIVSSRVLVAKVDISAGSFIRSEADLEWVAFPAENIPATYIKEDQQAASVFDGAVARSNISAGEPITSARIVKPDEGGFMSAVLTPGKRAVSIAVNATTGNAGFIFPGDQVDLILTHQVKEDTESGAEVAASETFIENARVLAVDQRFNSKESEVVLARTVTLEVTPKQAEMINIASDLGRISLSLRSLATDKQKQDGDMEFTDTASEEKTATDPRTSPATYTSDREVSRLLRVMHRDGDTVKVSVSRGAESEDLEFERR